MSQQVTRIDRSNLFIIAFQLDGICAALRHALSCGLAPGPATVKSLQQLHAAFAAIHSGPSLDVLPSIDFNSPPSDILAFAEVLRTTVGAFLSPDEVAERQRVIGFNQ